MHALRLMWELSRRPLEFLEELHRDGQDLVCLRSRPPQLYSLAEPELIRSLLVEHAPSTIKGRGLQLARRVLGDGLVTSNGTLHLRQRRLVQPSFFRQRLEEYAHVMQVQAAQHVESWLPSQVIEARSEMLRLTLAIITRAMFGTDIGERAERVERALGIALGRFNVGLIPILPWLERLPLASNRAFRSARQELDEILIPLIEERRRQGPGRDLLSSLLQAVDEGHSMSDRQLRDEAMTLFLAGHETTANALAWTLGLLAQYPEWQIEGQEERVLSESLRLYPPAWIMGRQLIQPIQLGPHSLPQGATLLFSAWVVQRQARFFPDPLLFAPQRWENPPPHKFAFFPFGGGNRICIGEHFARTEALIVLREITRKFQLRPLSPLAKPRCGITLRPAQPVPLLLQRKDS